jgi:hypothetical protein
MKPQLSYNSSIIVDYTCMLQYDKEENDAASNGKVQSFQEGRKPRVAK